MELLAENISEVFGITLEKSMEIYPFLRGQYQIYHSLHFAMFLVILISFINVLLIFSHSSNDPSEEFETDYTKKNDDGSYSKVTSEKYNEWLAYYNKLIKSLAFFVILFIILAFLQMILTPDILFIKNFLN